MLLETRVISTTGLSSSTGDLLAAGSGAPLAEFAVCCRQSRAPGCRQQRLPIRPQLTPCPPPMPPQTCRTWGGRSRTCSCPGISGSEGWGPCRSPCRRSGNTGNLRRCRSRFPGVWAAAYRAARTPTGCETAPSSCRAFSCCTWQKFGTNKSERCVCRLNTDRARRSRAWANTAH